MPAGPIGREFESLVRLLPEWALTYESVTIEIVRKALAHLEQSGEVPENLAPQKSVV
jgi:hypothetical protein